MGRLTQEQKEIENGWKELIVPLSEQLNHHTEYSYLCYLKGQGIPLTGFTSLKLNTLIYKYKAHTDFEDGEQVMIYQWKKH